MTDVECLRRRTLVDALAQQGLGDFPSREDLLVATLDRPLEWEPRLTKGRGQSEESWREQDNVIQQCVASIQGFRSGMTSFIPFVLVMGPPGSGKTHILLNAATYGLAVGLNVAIVSIGSERARALGGDHVHLLFPIPVVRGRQVTPQQLAQSCLARLLHDPMKETLLRRIDLFIFEEIGLLSAELFYVLDAVLRHVRASTVPWGGALVLASGDPRQLPPVQGRLLWATTHVITTFKIFALKHFVRSAEDIDLQEIITLLRRVNRPEEDCNKVVDIILRRCGANFVSSWDDVHDDTLRVVGTHAAEQEAVRRFTRSKENDSTLEKCYSIAQDEVEVSGGTWRAADKNITKVLNRHCLEMEHLLLFEGAVMRLTYNNTSDGDPSRRFSQGQLCIVTCLPDTSCPYRHQQIRVKIAPPGERRMPSDLGACQWNEISIRRRTTLPFVVGKGLLRGRRDQWPLRFYIANTVHKVMGDTCGRLATQISEENPKYRLWLLEQLIVIVSRVTTLDDLVFVGDVGDTLAAIKRLFLRRSQWVEHVDDVLQQLNVLERGIGDLHGVVTNQHHPFRPLHRELPSESLGFCYLLVSVRLSHVVYIGEASDLRRRLREHNSGGGQSGCCQEGMHLMPWHLLAYVTNFYGMGHDHINVEKRKEFKSQWQYRLNQWYSIQSVAESACNLGMSLVEEWNERWGESLVWVMCGEISQ